MRMYLKRPKAGIQLVVIALAWVGLTLPAGVSPAHAPSSILVTIQLRDSQGLGLAGVAVLILRPPENELANGCTTDATGRCQVALGRGIYAVNIAHSALSELNQLAVAEGGLGDLGITVGGEAITYGFVVAADGYLYFDAAPQAAQPEPIFPTEAMVHAHWLTIPTPTQPAGSPDRDDDHDTEPNSVAVHLAGPATPTPAPSGVMAGGNRPVGRRSGWPFSLLETTLILGAGGLLGGSIALCQSRRQQKEAAGGRFTQ